MDKKEINEEYTTIDCSCGMDALRLYTDKDFMGGMIEIAFWKYGQDRKRPLWNKIRQIWRILKTGTPYSDMVILDKKGIDLLKDFLKDK